jgi:hypothetical protein
MTSPRPTSGIEVAPPSPPHRARESHGAPPSRIHTISSATQNTGRGRPQNCRASSNAGGSRKYCARARAQPGGWCARQVARALAECFPEGKGGPAGECGGVGRGFAAPHALLLRAAGTRGRAGLRGKGRRARGGGIWGRCGGFYDGGSCVQSKASWGMLELKTAVHHLRAGCAHHTGEGAFPMRPSGGAAKADNSAARTQGRANGLSLKAGQGVLWTGNVVQGAGRWRVLAGVENVGGFFAGFNCEYSLQAPGHPLRACNGDAVLPRRVRHARVILAHSGRQAGCGGLRTDAPARRAHA